MIAELKPYPAMKESGVEWLGEVPEHWSMSPSKALFKHRREKARPDDQQLTASQRHGIISQDEFMALEGRVMSVFIGRDILKHVEPDDFVISMRSFQGGLEWSKVRGAISSAYVMLIPTEDVHPPFFAHLLKSSGYIAALRRTSDLVRDGQALRYANFAQVPLPRIPIPEQEAMVRYLDHVHRRVRRLVRAKQKLVELLMEQKQAIVHQAVTGGLDPDVPLKDSGVEWLGQFPEHWGFNRGKYYFVETNIRSTTGEEELLSVSHLTGVTPRRQKNITMFKAASYVGSKVCSPGQIAVNTMWAWMAAMGVSRFHGIISPAYHTYERLDPGSFSDEYLDLLLRSNAYKALYTASSRGITSSRLRLYPDDFLNLRFLCPPLDEQEEIVHWLKEHTAHIDSAIARASREIELLDELRSGLTSDVVTGKVDVRKAAAALPDVDPGDAVDDLDDALNLAAENELDGILEEADA